MKKYKNQKYYQDENGLWKVKINNTDFIVALDDSKTQTNKKIIKEKNNETTCKEYIDWFLK